MMSPFTSLTLTLALASAMPASLHASDLRGSLASMIRQHRVAERNNFTFLRTPAQVREFVRKDRLEPVRTTSDILIDDASFPYARPQVVLFVQRLAEQYHDATGYRLVVTSLTRPLNRQPPNAHRLSVHPAGMAVDLHVPGSASARRWLEQVLLSLERKGLLDATREHYPSHYHVAVFPQKYEDYVERIDGATVTLASASEPEDAPPSASLEPDDVASDVSPVAAPMRLSGPLAAIAALAVAFATLVLMGLRSTLGSTAAD